MAPAHFDGLKVFPLPSVVLFPKTAVPLHIFEPRYRDLVADALATDSVMAMGQVLETMNF
jgi:Lon protease-like protein